VQSINILPDRRTFSSSSPKGDVIPSLGGCAGGARDLARFYSGRIRTEADLASCKSALWAKGDSRKVDRHKGTGVEACKVPRPSRPSTQARDDMLRLPMEERRGVLVRPRGQAPPRDLERTSRNCLLLLRGTRGALRCFLLWFLGLFLSAVISLGHRVLLTFASTPHPS